MLDNLENLVVRTRQGYGGLGVYIMPDLAGEFRTNLARNIIEQPRMFIEQETLDFSRHLIFDEESGEFEERYIDLSAFAGRMGVARPQPSRAASPGFPGPTAASQTTHRVAYANQPGWFAKRYGHCCSVLLRSPLCLQ